MTSKCLPSVSIIPLANSSNDTTLLDFCKGKRGIIDIWHKKCIKCPAALSALNDFAGKSNSDIIFIACALAQEPGDLEEVTDLTQEWGNIQHIFVDIKDKAALKEFFGYSSVPYYIIFEKDGSIVLCGEPKAVDYKTILQSWTKKEENKASNASDGNVFSLDEDF